MRRLPHQIITKTIGGQVTELRHPAEGGARYAVTYQNNGGAQPWLSKHRFYDAAQADAGALALAPFLGGEAIG